MLWACEVVMARLIQSNTQRQTAATLRLHRDDTSFFMDEQRLEKAITGARDPESCWTCEASLALSAAGTASRGVMSRALSVEASRSLALTNSLTATKSLKGPGMLHSMRSSVTEQMDDHLPRYAHLCSLPMLAVRYIAMEGPLGSVLSRSIFTTSATRALLFAVDTLSALVFVTMFFSVTGGVQARRQEAMDCELKSTWEMVGRLIAIAVASVAIGGIPGAVFSSLQTRGPKVCNSLEERRRQIRAWRCQDITLWGLALGYIAFSINFIVLFFANVDVGNVIEWMTTAGISLLQDHLLLPLSVVVLHSSLTMLLIAIVARSHGVKKRDLVQKYRVEKLLPKERKEAAQVQGANESKTCDSCDLEAMRAPKGKQTEQHVAEVVGVPTTPFTLDVTLNTFCNSPISEGLVVCMTPEAEGGDDLRRRRCLDLEVAWTPPIPLAHPPPGHRLPPLPGAVPASPTAPLPGAVPSSPRPLEQGSVGLGHAT